MKVYILHGTDEYFGDTIVEVFADEAAAQAKCERLGGKASGYDVQDYPVTTLAEAAFEATQDEDRFATPEEGEAWLRMRG